MIKFIFRRLAVAVFQLLLITLIAYFLFFVVANATGANPAQRIAGKAASPERVAEVAHILGTDLPWYEQYFRFVGNMLHGDLGYSFMLRRPVAEIIVPGVTVTASLLAGAAFLWVLMAVPVGIVGALWPRSLPDRTLTVIIQIAISAPVFWVSPMLSYWLAYQPSQGTLFGIPLGRPIMWVPIQGYTQFGANPWEWARDLLLPWIALAIGYAALYARFVRALVSEQLGEDYVLVARAKGASESRISGFAHRPHRRPFDRHDVGTGRRRNDGRRLVCRASLRPARFGLHRLQLDPIVGLSFDHGHHYVRRTDGRAA